MRCIVDVRAPRTSSNLRKEERRKRSESQRRQGGGRRLGGNERRLVSELKGLTMIALPSSRVSKVGYHLLELMYRSASSSHSQLSLSLQGVRKLKMERVEEKDRGQRFGVSFSSPLSRGKRKTHRTDLPPSSEEK